MTTIQVSPFELIAGSTSDCAQLLPRGATKCGEGRERDKKDSASLELADSSQDGKIGGSAVSNRDAEEAV